MKQWLRSFRDDFHQSIQNNRDRPALITLRQNNVITYGDLNLLIDRMATLFQKIILAPARPIMVIMPNSEVNFIVFLTTIRQGLSYIPVAQDITPRELDDLINLVNPSLCLIDPEISDQVMAVLKQHKIQLIETPVDGDFSWLPEEATTPPPPSSNNSRLYLATSGSTGQPLAMVLDSDILWSAAVAFTKQHEFLDQESRFLNNLPMSYLGGLFNLGLIPLAASGSLVITESFSGRSFLSFWQDVERFDVNVLWLVPSIINGLLAIAHRTKRHELIAGKLNIKAAFVGTAPISLTQKQQFEDIFDIPILENMGLSETTFISSETLNTSHQRKDRSVGEIMPWIEYRLKTITFDDKMQDNTQELQVKTPFLFLGYLDSEGSIKLPVDSEQFFSTGDIGNIDKNILVLDGRLRDFIKKGGYFVSLREIEILAEKHETIEEAAAVAMAHPFFSEDFNLFLKLRSGRQDNKKVLAQFSMWLHSNLVKYKWPGSVQIVDDFPRTATGKIRKHLITITNSTKAASEPRIGS
jgi:acyl-CoA synthetase (AMP-forming)/AMP-acid ligase II